MSDWKNRIISDDEGLTRVLRAARTVAVLGAKAGINEPAYYVPAYLAARGYRILPVNPTLTGRSLFGARVAPTLADLAEPADVIDVFRRPEFLPGHAREILELPWRPATVWFQLGIRHDGAAEILARAGLLVIQDRCMMPEHRRLIGGMRDAPPQTPRSA
jgi:predicted CoA-binding protein